MASTFTGSDITRYNAGQGTDLKSLPVIETTMTDDEKPVSPDAGSRSRPKTRSPRLER